MGTPCGLHECLSVRFRKKQTWKVVYEPTDWTLTPQFFGEDHNGPGKEGYHDALPSSHWGHPPSLSEHLWADSYPRASALLEQHFLHPPSAPCNLPSSAPLGLPCLHLSFLTWVSLNIPCSVKPLLACNRIGCTCCMYPGGWNFSILTLISLHCNPWADVLLLH